MSLTDLSGSDAVAFESQLAELLEAARDGGSSEIAALVEAWREQLIQIAERTLDSDVRPKESPSDIVQESLIEAQRDFKQFRGQTVAEFHGWLKRILVNNLLNAYRRWRQSQKRDIHREVSLDGLSNLSDANAGTPSDILSRQEREDRLNQALDALPVEFREIVVLRHREHMTFDAIGAQTNRTADQARGLWHRAIEALASELASTS